MTLQVESEEKDQRQNTDLTDGVRGVRSSVGTLAGVESFGSEVTGTTGAGFGLDGRRATIAAVEAVVAAAILLPPAAELAAVDSGGGAGGAVAGGGGEDLDGGGERGEEG